MLLENDILSTSIYAFDVNLRLKDIILPVSLHTSATYYAYNRYNKRAMIQKSISPQKTTFTLYYRDNSNIITKEI